MIARAAPRALLLGLLTVFAAACSSAEEVKNQPCPPVVLLDAAKDMTVFREGQGRDLTDVRYWFAITGLTASCAYREGLLAGVIDVAGAIRIEAEKGPAAPDGPAGYTFFASITDRARDVLRKDLFTGRVAFSGNESRAAAVQSFATSIALLPNQNGLDYIVYVGFQLAPEQLLYRRHRPND